MAGESTGDLLAKIAINQNSVMAQDSAWVQKDAHWSKGPANPAKQNPFVPVQSPQVQTGNTPASPVGTKSGRE